MKNFITLIFSIVFSTLVSCSSADDCTKTITIPSRNIITPTGSAYIPESQLLVPCDYVDKSDSIAETFIKLLGTISAAAGAIGFITLVGAAIGLMNIMLVAVTERTKEVGLIKALGGKRNSIRAQFLFESTLISLMGAVIGILLGVMIGNLVGSLMDTPFFIPWKIISIGIIICSAVGITAGLYPAMKASKLDPIVALRYE